VDEVDSILIDEARTPLIISGPAEESTDKYYKINQIMPRLKDPKFYTIDEKARTVALTEEGVAQAESLLGVENLYDPKNVEQLHHIHQAMKAHRLFKRDVDYVVKENEVVIVDEFTGRLMPGRRYSDGLHQALEAKEGVKIENENQTLATITFQNYFRLYKKLAGMTGTADTEATEFNEIYKLEVLQIPTNMEMIRLDHPDVIYRTEREKYQAVIEGIKELYQTGQPVLVGTISIEKSERLSALLKREGIPHNVLNAKNHEKEAEIIAQAGRKKAVTISTNMAGRGTDIVLGGNPEMLVRAKGIRQTDERYESMISEFRRICSGEKGEVKSLGGLHILGTERHESRRIDNQLRGRSGRQGDAGSSRFYLSLEDDLLRIFGSEKISGFMQRVGMEEGEPIEHKLVTRAIENAQRKVEAHNFEIRKHLLEYDDVMNKQREVVYGQRHLILNESSLKDHVLDMAQEVLEETVELHCDEKLHPDEWDLNGLKEAVLRQFDVALEVDEQRNMKVGDARIPYEEVTPGLIYDALEKRILEAYEEKEKTVGEGLLRQVEKYFMLQVLDAQWKDHLLAMDHLKEGIGFRGYAQKNPLNEYKKEGFDLFMGMVARMKGEIVTLLFKFKVSASEEMLLEHQPRRQRLVEHRGQNNGGQKQQTVRREAKKVGRNEPCPCGSGKKYKKCCGVAA
jgi:preprotein translocase subunit SecA